MGDYQTVNGHFTIGFHSTSPPQSAKPLHMDRKNSRQKPTMGDDPVRQLIRQLLDDSGKTMKAASLAIGRSDTRIFEYLNKGIPKELPEKDRLHLAEYLGIEEQSLRDGRLRLKHEPTTAVDAGYELLYRLAVAVPDTVLPWELPAQERTVFPPLPLSDAPASGWAAQIMDDHADRAFPAGTVILAVSPTDHPNLLRVGARVVIRRFESTKDAGVIADLRVMTLGLSEDGFDILLQPLTARRDLRLFLTLPRLKPIPAQAMPYRPNPADQAEIMGVVIGSYQSEPI